MSVESGNARLGGLRREHIVASALVAAVTVVLGFASGFGVRDAGAAAPPGVAAAPPGAQQKGPQAAAAGPARAARVTGSKVGLRPGAHSDGRPGGPATTGAGLGNPPHHHPAPGLSPATPPVDPGGSAPQCPPGVLDQVLALVAQALGGTAPAQDRSVFPVGVADASPVGVPGGAKRPTLRSVDGRTVPVAGLGPLLDPVAARERGRTAAASADQLAQLSAVLAPLGLELDPARGLADPLLVPVLGSVGCTGIVPAEPAGAVR